VAAPGRRLFPILKLTPDTGITIAEATALCQWAGVRSRAAAVSSAVAVDRLRRGHDLARRLAAEPAAPVPLHGDLHPGNVLDGGAGRGLVAIDPRPCVGETAVDLVDRVFRGLDDRRLGAARPRPRARAGPRAPRVWAWCAAFAAMLAAAKAARGARAGEVAALLALAP
jgi:streptomycin 6-kinase